MTRLRHMTYCLPLLCLTALPCRAEPLSPTAEAPLLVEHLDPLEIDPGLSLSQLVEQTLDKFPDRLISQALADEASALKIRGDAWFAGSTALALEYADDRIGSDKGARDASASLEWTPWFWGQRSAAQNIAEQAGASAAKQSALVKLEVARLTREALWAIALADNRLQQARNNLEISKQLLAKVERRVELGDLPRADLLLAETDHLQNQSVLAQAEAELMHSRKAYSSLTQTTHVPANFTETLSTIQEVRPDHPLLEAINALISRRQAEVEWAKTTDTVNQPKVHIGANSSRDAGGGNDLQSANIGVVIPFGHSTYDAPEIAAAYLELNRMLAQREHLQRQLEKGLHEAEHTLEVNRTELAIAQRMREIARQHLQMMTLSFEAGEINLLDLLKIQARSFEATRYAKEQEVNLRRNTAFYNQAVGVLP